jgi:hypothetical protein
MQETKIYPLTKINYGRKNQIHQYLFVKPDLAKKLQAEALRSPTFNAICTVFALRERSRKQITINGLALYMIKEGFNYTKKDYEECLKFLASVNVGVPDLDLKNRFRGIKDINLALQSLGKAALDQDVVVPTRNIKLTVPLKKNTRLVSPQASIMITIGDRTINIDVPTADATKYLMDAIKAGQQ